MKLEKPIKSLTDVALSFYKQLASTERAKITNTLVSPPSINTVLSLIGSGSKGSTLRQILSFLNLKSKDELSSYSSNLASLVFADGSSSGGPRLSLANGLWIDKSLTLKPSFKQVADNVYKATANQADFQTKAEETRKEVNKWADMKTNGLITEILPPGAVNEFTRLVFANAIYFKGIWENKFDKSATKKYEYHIVNGTSVKVPFMTSWKSQMVSCFEGFKVLRLPYEQGRNEGRYFSMYIFLPDADDGLPSLVDKMCSESGFLEDHLPCEYVEVDKFRIPRFEFTLGFEASDVLKGLGLELPFSSTKADITEMVDDVVNGNDRLCVESLYHKCIIKFNEEGTEAAAFTGICCGNPLGYKPPPRVDFVANHPFLFLIREDVSGVVLFIGHLLNPLE